MFTKRSAHGAFTLIECLASIAVVALLLALVIAGLGRVRESAMNARATSNMRQSLMGLSLYANDHRGDLMWPWGAYPARQGAGFRNMYWGEVVVEGGYLGGETQGGPDVLRNPGRPTTATSGYGATFALRALNEGRGTRYNPFASYNVINLRTVENPSSYFVLTEAYGEWIDGIVQFAACTMWNPPWLGRNGRALVGFADGSVKAKDANFFLEDPQIENSWIRNGPGVRNWE